MSAVIVRAKNVDIEQLNLFNVKLSDEKNEQKRILSFHEVLGPILTGFYQHKLFL